MESKAPSLWFFVVSLKHIDTLSTEILPVFDRLFDPDCFGDFFPKSFEKSRLSTADIALNSEATKFGVGVGLIDWRGVKGLVAERDGIEGGIHMKFYNRFYLYLNFAI